MSFVKVLKCFWDRIDYITVWFDSFYITNGSFNSNFILIDFCLISRLINGYLFMKFNNFCQKNSSSWLDSIFLWNFSLKNLFNRQQISSKTHKSSDEINLAHKYNFSSQIEAFFLILFIDKKKSNKAPSEVIKGSKK